MTFHQVLDELFSNTLGSLRVFGPELTLCITILVMLIVRIASTRRTERLNLWITSWLPMIGALVALYLAEPWTHLSDMEFEGRRELFTGMLMYDPLTVYFRAFLMVFLVLFFIFTQLSGMPNRGDSADVYTLVLGATVGMLLMAAANHLLIVFLAIEMASVPSYALAGALRGRRDSSEAAIKYAVYGAGAAGVMLYGISLLGGMLGSVHLPTMAVRLGEMLHAGPPNAEVMVLVLGGLMLSVGLAFKLSAVPFHFWCPDVFEGASAEIGAFLSIASKGAALALLLRVCIGFGYVPATVDAPELASQSSVHTVAYRAADEAGAPSSPLSRDELIAALAPAREYIVLLVTLLSVVTCTFGNLAAYGQTNIKRLLAYSTIAHAGYMMMPVAAAIALIGQDRASTLLAEEAIAALAFYIGVYVFMNLGAFAIVAFLRNAMHSEEIEDYAGLVTPLPFVTVCFSLVLLSLLGLPPLAGFVAKFAIFKALVAAQLWFLLVVGGLNTVVSLFYYVRVIKVMTLDPEPENRLPSAFPLPWLASVYIVAVSLMVVVIGLWSNPLAEWTMAAASKLLS